MSGETNDAVCAAEYVLGLLPEAERRSFEARVVVEPALAAELAFWQAGFADLAEAEVVPVAPPPQVKSWTEAKLFAKPVKRERPRRLRPFLWGLLFGAAGAGMIAAGFVAVQAGLRLPVDMPEGLLPPPGPAYLAQIDHPEVALVAWVRTAVGAALVEVAVLRGSEPDLELWLLPVEEGPVSLGPVPTTGRLAVPLGARVAGALDGARLGLARSPEVGASEAPDMIVTVPLTGI